MDERDNLDVAEDAADRYRMTKSAVLISMHNFKEDIAYVCLCFCKKCLRFQKELKLCPKLVCRVFQSRLS